MHDQNGVYQLVLRDTAHGCTQSCFDQFSFGSRLQNVKVVEKNFQCQRGAVDAQQAHLFSNGGHWVQLFGQVLYQPSRTQDGGAKVQPGV